MPVKQNGQLFLIKVSGPDHPGITSELMHIISKYGDEVIDIGQAVTHGLLSLSFVIRIHSVKDGHSAVVRDLLFKAKEMDLQLEYEDITEDSKFEESAEGQNFVLNCVAPEKIEPTFIRDVASILAEKNINIQRIDKVSPDSFSSLEVTTRVPNALDLNQLKQKLMDISTKYQVDVAFLKDNVFRRSKRLIVFDMDSTLIQSEVIDEMANKAGSLEQVRALTQKAMSGEIDFQQSLEKRVATLKNLKVDDLNDILQNLPLTPGAREFVSTVKKLGYKVGIVSGGFSFFAEALKEKLELDYAFANELEWEGDRLSGKVKYPIVDAEQKAIILKLLAKQEGVNMEQVVAIGDGANDLPMLSAAGLGIAFHAKDIVREKAEQQMSHGPMTSILYFLGIPGPKGVKNA